MIPAELLAALRAARALELDHQRWFVEQHPLNRYPPDHPHYRPPRPKPTPSSSAASVMWFDAALALRPYWDAGIPLHGPHPEPGTLALWQMHPGAFVPVRLAHRTGPQHDGPDWFVERLDDPEPQPRVEPSGYTRPALQPARYRVEYSHSALRVLE